MFLNNNWYVAGFSQNLAAGTLRPIRICNQPLVLFRTAAGEAVALEDRCIHRGMPVSKGGTCGTSSITCPYHGLEFNAAGECIRVPGQEHIPSAARMRKYPLVEKDAMLWVWPGDPARADASAIVSQPFHGDPSWVWTCGTLHVKANWQLLIDNLLDLSHLQYVHRKTIGGNPEEDASAILKAERSGDRVEVSRWLLDMAAPPFHRAACGFKGNIDRWQEFRFQPATVQFYSGATDANTGAYEGRREGGMHLRHFHAITPETEHGTTYFFTQARNFATGQTELTDRLHKMMVMTFEEDMVILEPQDQRLTERSGQQLLNIRADAGTLHARRIIEELLAAEAQSRTTPLAAGA